MNNIITKHGPRFIDYTNQIINGFEFIEFMEVRSKNSLWKVRCPICKDLFITTVYHIKSKKQKSCGCVCYNKLPNGEASFNSLYSHRKACAIRRNLIFELTKDNFRILTQQNCYYCGEPPSQVHRKDAITGGYVYNGIDRLDNNIGYILSNCVACCSVCNFMKTTFSYEVFISQVNKIYRFNHGQIHSA